MLRRLNLGVLILLMLFTLGDLKGAAASEQDQAFLSWNKGHAVSIGKSMREKGRIGGLFDFRIIHTEHSYNYKLRATWLTPEVIRASAKMEQINSYLSDQETLELVAEAEAAGDTVILVEIDPREGSGVIPGDWLAVLQPKGLPEGETGGVRGESKPALRKAKALAGVMKRDYNYDVFWVVFPLVNDRGETLFSDSVKEAELLVRINGKEGRVDWTIPFSIRHRAKAIGSVE